MKLSGKVVMITGGSEGIGAACAREFAARGALPSILDLQPARSAPAGSLFTMGDVTAEESRKLFLSRTLERFGKVDVLVNNAGCGYYATPANSSLDLARRLFELNVFAPMALSQAASAQMKNGGGTIVNIASIGAEVALPWAAAYCASKSAIASYSESLRRELGRDGIRVITVYPGVVNTRFRDHVLAGVAPAKVAAMGGMPPERLAKAIANRIEGRGSNVFKPWLGRVFALGDRVARWSADFYIEQRWNGRMGEERRAEPQGSTPESLLEK